MLVSRLAFVWQVQYTEPLEGAAVQYTEPTEGAACRCGRGVACSTYTDPPEGAAARIVAAGLAQYTELPEGAAARIVAAVAAAGSCVAGAAHRAS